MRLAAMPDYPPEPPPQLPAPVVPSNEDTAIDAPANTRSLADWFSSPQGAYVLEWERNCMDQIVADLFGYFAIQAGLPDIDFLQANRIPWRTSLSTEGRAGVVADPHELPFAAESLDLVVLPHLLECASEPHQILREVERVLRPEGELIISGFNPVSLWGVRKLFGPSAAPPWNAEFVSVLRMKDWLKLLNFEIRGGRFGCYRPPFESAKWLSRFAVLENLGSRWWPVAGGVYIMQAKKRVAGMRVIRPARRRVLAEGREFAPTTHKFKERNE